MARTVHSGCLSLKLFAFFALFALAPLACLAQTATFNLPAQPLADSLKVVGAQAGINVMVSPSLVDGRQAPPLKANLSVKEALTKLLVGTGLDYHFVNDQTVVIREKEAGAVHPADSPAGQRTSDMSQDKEAGKNSSQKFRVSQVDQASIGPQIGGVKQITKKNEKLEEIVVTGTHIHGANPISPITTLDRSDIDASGSGTIQDVLAKLPQNFGGGITESTGASAVPGQDQGNNVGFGTGINLRGLGSDATLVLLNGHRLTPTGAGNFVDVSQIPAGAVERIEVITDGASAIYGSDAVAGVVNIILRDNYDGAETRGRYGEVTSGSLNEYGAGQTFGGHWASGNALVTYDFYDRKDLTRENRPFASDPVRDLLPAQKHSTVLFDGQQALWSGATASLDGLYSERTSKFLGAYPFTPGSPVEETDSKTRSYSFSPSFRMELGSSWFGEVALLTSRERVDWSIDVGGPPFSQGDTFDNRLYSAQAKVDGGLLNLPGGTLKGVVGSEFRRESFTDDYHGGLPNIVASRNVSAAFLEFDVPLVGDSNASAYLRRVQLNGAVRYEHYSDFGSSTNPQFGIAWQPLSAWTARATWSKSFRAPNFNQTAGNLNSVSYFPFQDPQSSTGFTNGLQLYGSRSGVGPETATTTTAGIDFQPAQAKSKVSISYFDTTFKNRIAIPDPASIDMLINANAYGSLIRRDPTPAQIGAALAYAPLFDYTGGVSTTEAGAILDNRYQNLSSTKVDGVDLQAAYVISTHDGDLDLSFSGSHLFSFKNRALADSNPNQVLNTLYNPLGFRGRAGIGWLIPHWSVNAFLNYSRGYINNITTPSESISSWTTMDVSAAYDTDRIPSLPNLSIRMSVQNLYNRYPPYVSSPTAEVLPTGYDPANASPLGRFVSVSFTMKWL